MKENFFTSPTFLITLLSESSLPIGTSGDRMFGMTDKIVVNSLFIFVNSSSFVEDSTFSSFPSSAFLSLAATFFCLLISSMSLINSSRFLYNISRLSKSTSFIHLSFIDFLTTSLFSMINCISNI